MKQSGMIYGLALVSPFCFAVNDTVIIQGHGDESIDKVVLQEQLSQIPGGTNLIDTNALAGSQSSLAKVLNQQAGIIVQEFLVVMISHALISVALAYKTIRSTVAFSCSMMDWHSTKRMDPLSSA
ncbi:hypothetical protein OA15_10180 [Vibrio vulnificus]|nr:hypothetical protein OA15_10180 [Vibrio vulnificus]